MISGAWETLSTEDCRSWKVPFLGAQELAPHKTWSNYLSPACFEYSNCEHATHTMSKRLQVLLPDQEMSDLQRLAKRERVTVGEWVRRVLRESRASRPAIEPETKLKAVRRAAEYSFPTADVKQMLTEIERGYGG